MTVSERQAQEQFEERRRAVTTDFCWDGRDWALGYPDLASAWAACPRGTWMAFWLRTFDGRDRSVRRRLKNIATRAVGYKVSGTLTIDSYPAAGRIRTDADDQVFADAIRREFHYDGTPARKPVKVTVRQRLLAELERSFKRPIFLDTLQHTLGVPDASIRRCLQELRAEGRNVSLDGREVTLWN